MATTIWRFKHSVSVSETRLDSANGTRVEIRNQANRHVERTNSWRTVSERLQTINKRLQARIGKLQAYKKNNEEKGWNGELITEW